MSDALALGLTSFHCPIYTDWQSNSDLTHSVDSIHSKGIVNSTTQEFTVDVLTKQVIHPNANSVTPKGTGTGIVNSTTWEFTMDTLMKQAIINHPKYASLFSGIGHFRCKPVHITMRQNSIPVQKLPRKCLLS